MIKTIYIPIEIKDREFYSKLFFSKKALEHGYRICIGPKEIINSLVSKKKVKSDIYFNKAGFKDVNISSIRNKIDLIIVQDEEIGPSFDAEKFKLRLTQLNQNLIDIYFAYNDRVVNMAKSEYVYLDSKKIVSSGWIREEMWFSRPNFFVDKSIKIRKRYGEFLLFSSNYGIDHSRYSFNKLNMDKVNWNLYHASFVKNKQKMHHVISFLNSLKSFTMPFKIIVRPHPTDDKKIWEKGLKNNKNVKVIYKESITPWLLASKGLLHTGCTSAIEANLLNVKSAYLNLFTKSDYFKESIELSEIINDSEELLNFYYTKIKINRKKIKETSKIILNEIKKFDVNSGYFGELNQYHKIMYAIRKNIKRNLLVKFIKNYLFNNNTPLKLGNGLLKKEISQFLNEGTNHYTLKKISLDCYSIERKNNI